MIRVQGLSKKYGAVHAIREVTFSVERGEIVGFLGPNGAGKTTTMRIITGFTPATRGTATIAGFEVAQQPLEVKRNLGYLPENVPLYPEMTVRGFLTYTGEIKGVPRAQRRSEAERVMERTGLTEMGHRAIGHLSKGYRQRVGLAQALVGNPPVLILDEPTVGLDPKQIIEIRGMIKGLAPEHTILLSTHILPEVQMICERVIIIHEGHIVAQNSLAQSEGEGDAVHVDLEVAGERAKITATIESVAGVRSVTSLGEGRFRVQAGDSEGLSESLVQALCAAGLGVRAIQTGSRSLEEMFVEAIAAEDNSGR